MISASKTTFSLNNLNILRPKITKKIVQICLISFVNFQPVVSNIAKSQQESVKQITFLKWHLPSISSTLYAHVFCMNFLPKQKRN